MKTIKEVYGDAVKQQVAACNNAGIGWGRDQSVRVVEALCDAAYLDGEAPAGFDAIRVLVGQLVNPSAFYQQLQKLAPTHPCSMPAKGKVAATDLPGM